MFAHIMHSWVGFQIVQVFKAFGLRRQGKITEVKNDCLSTMDKGLLCLAFQRQSQKTTNYTATADCSLRVHSTLQGSGSAAHER